MNRLLITAICSDVAGMMKWKGTDDTVTSLMITHAWHCVNRGLKISTWPPFAGLLQNSVIGPRWGTYQMLTNRHIILSKPDLIRRISDPSFLWYLQVLWLHLKLGGNNKSWWYAAGLKVVRALTCCFEKGHTPWSIMWSIACTKYSCLKYFRWPRHSCKDLVILLFAFPQATGSVCLMVELAARRNRQVRIEILSVQWW